MVRFLGFVCYGLGMWRSLLDVMDGGGVSGGQLAVGTLVEFAERVLGWELEAKQRELLDGSLHRVILNCTRQWGKSSLAAVMVLHRALREPGALVLLAGPGLRQSRELLLKVRRVAERAGVSWRRDRAQPEGMEFENGSRVVALPDRAERVRGFTDVRLIVIDEAALVSASLYEALRPMLVQSRGDLWMLSTPAGRRGVFYEEWSRGADDWRRVMVRATECSRFGAAALEVERSTLGDRKFAQEFLCEFVELEEGMFPEDWFARVITNDEEVEEALVL
jgi:hypothetical protein